MDNEERPIVFSEELALVDQTLIEENQLDQARKYIFEQEVQRQIQIDKEAGVTGGVRRWSNRLQADGSPQPSMILRNIEDKNFPDPRNEFVMSEQPVTNEMLSQNWLVPTNIISLWRAAGAWDSARVKYWADIEKNQWAVAGEVMAEVRGKTLARHRTSWQTMQELILGMARSGGKEKINPNGSTTFIPFDPGDANKLTSALQRATTGELISLGLSAVNARDAAELGDLEDVTRPVVNMNFNFAGSPQDLIKQINAVPTPGEIIEGEVTEDKEG